MQASYLVLITVLFFFVLLLDLFYAKVSLRYPRQLILVVLFCFPIFFFLVYMGIAMNIWFYNGQGIMGVYYLSIPIEEYAYMVFAPYSSIVVWEAFHRAIRRKKR